MLLLVAAVAAAISMLMILRPSTRTSVWPRVCKPKCRHNLLQCVASTDEALLILDSYVDGMYETYVRRTFGMVETADLLRDTMPRELVDAGLHMVCGLLHIMYKSDPTPLTVRHYAVLPGSILAQEDNITFKTDVFQQDFATETDDKQPLVHENIGSFPYLHPRKMLNKWLQT